MPEISEEYIKMEIISDEINYKQTLSSSFNERNLAQSYSKASIYQSFAECALSGKHYRKIDSSRCYVDEVETEETVLEVSQTM